MEYPISGAKLTLKGVKKWFKSQSGETDEDGFYEFTDMEAATYIVIAKASGYKQGKKTVKLKAEEPVDVEIKLKKK